METVDTSALVNEVIELRDRLRKAETELAHATMAAEAEADYADRLKAKLDAAEKDIVRQERIIELYESEYIDPNMIAHAKARYREEQSK